jgi:hypothetical protein
MTASFTMTGRLRGDFDCERVGPGFVPENSRKLFLNSAMRHKAANTDSAANRGLDARPARILHR